MNLTVQSLVERARSELSRQASGRLDAELLLGHVLNCDRSCIYARPERTLQGEQIGRFWNLVEERRQGVPIAYLTGYKEFWSLDFRVNRKTLIPRPETELLVEIGLECIAADSTAAMLELGTGSGAVSIALASERPHCSIYASDIDTDTLAVARENSERLVPGRISLFISDWLSHIEGRFDLIVSNPPYVTDQELGELSMDIQHEPISALAGGEDGLNAIRQIIADSGAYLKPGGWLLLEHGADHANRIRELLFTAGYEEIETRKDLAGHDRVTRGRAITRDYS